MSVSEYAASPEYQAHLRQSRLDLQEFINGYIGCCLWANALEYVPGPNGYEEPELGSVDLTAERDRLTFDALKAMVRDAMDFYRANYPEMHPAVLEGCTWERMGELFALSRGGHGTGFFDQGFRASQRLQDAARVYGSQDLLIHLTDRKIEVL